MRPNGLRVNCGQFFDGTVSLSRHSPLPLLRWNANLLLIRQQANTNAKLQYPSRDSSLLEKPLPRFLNNMAHIAVVSRCGKRRFDFFPRKRITATEIDKQSVDGVDCLCVFFLACKHPFGLSVENTDRWSPCQSPPCKALAGHAGLCRSKPCRIKPNTAMPNRTCFLFDFVNTPLASSPCPTATRRAGPRQASPSPAPPAGPCPTKPGACELF